MKYEYWWDFEGDNIIVESDNPSLPVFKIKIEITEEQKQKQKEIESKFDDMDVMDYYKALTDVGINASKQIRCAEMLIKHLEDSKPIEFEPNYDFYKFLF